MGPDQVVEEYPRRTPRGRYPRAAARQRLSERTQRQRPQASGAHGRSESRWGGRRFAGPGRHAPRVSVGPASRTVPIISEAWLAGLIPMPEGLNAPASAANAPRVPGPGVGDGTALEDGPNSLPGGYHGPSERRATPAFARASAADGPDPLRIHRRGAGTAFAARSPTLCPMR